MKAFLFSGRAMRSLSSLQESEDLSLVDCTSSIFSVSGCSGWIRIWSWVNPCPNPGYSYSSGMHNHYLNSSYRSKNLRISLVTLFGWWCLSSVLYFRSKKSGKKVSENWRIYLLIYFALFPLTHWSQAVARIPLSRPLGASRLPQ